MSILAFLAAKRGIGEDNVEGLRCVFKEAAVGFLAGEGVAMPEVWFVDTVQHQIGKGNGIDEILFFPAPEGALFERFELFGGGIVTKPFVNVFEALSKKAAGSTTGIVDGFINAGIDHLHHCFDNLTRREELASIVAFFTHFQQQSFVDLREGEDVCFVDGFGCELVHLVEHIEKVLFGINTNPVNTGHDFADDLLTG